MQVFSCPFCGPRPETEFHFGGDAGNTRPEGDVESSSWTNYLYFCNNRRGIAREIWMHLPCREIFIMERDTLTHAVKKTESLVPDLPVPDVLA
jgi:sarcosine oxidase subunit delta